MDEAVMLGLGNSLRENGYKEGSLLIREHCDRVMDICKTLGLKPMIWSDMYITANTRGGYYDVPENADCSQWEKPDRNLGWYTGTIIMMISGIMRKCWIFMNSFQIILYLQADHGYGMEFLPITPNFCMYQCRTWGM